MPWHYFWIYTFKFPQNKLRLIFKQIRNCAHENMTLTKSMVVANRVSATWVSFSAFMWHSVSRHNAWKMEVLYCFVVDKSYQKILEPREVCKWYALSAGSTAFYFDILVPWARAKESIRGNKFMTMHFSHSSINLANRTSNTNDFTHAWSHLDVEERRQRRRCGLLDVVMADHRAREDWQRFECKTWCAAAAARTMGV